MPHENYGQSRARKTWKSVWACDPWDARTNLNLLLCCGHMQTCGLRVFFDVLKKRSQEPVRLSYGACVTDIQEGRSQEQLWITVKPFIQ